ncbi:tRNA (5-methylaminomethyl-2-thiouridine)(34)-methyltransferase MnmD [Mucilaginibacter sp.]|uniref:tRNA (5-methylaminomethyl-2-thiouridine)(34)-methyltransferase MnmD n=1 Tax=Mucilaginibacter sp. TaxID=1882438 RepID=UPI002601E464|nr:tRNA (5-methylaminomethyl-2-thiouridine)(34)-methyltransferase MnmD [Mucilaginibacter sp.]MDB4921382.1 tRNA 5-methylaminomethyl-2-thiouridine-forming methyltransferase MnmC [Mucilaginibacter sp.]
MLKIVQTADGSNTIYNALVGENYHSKHGALQESRHVFVNSGLQYFLDGAADLEAPVSVLEVGFGTGLNFLLSADLCDQKHINLNYTGIEAYPLTKEMIGQTGYDQYVSTELWQQFIEQYANALSREISISPNCKLQIANTPLLNFQSAQQYDIIYFDAFAAAYQPEMWDETAIGHTIQYLKPGGVFVTYAITGNLKRAIKALDCKVEKAPGAPGKREMLRAVKINR